MQTANENGQSLTTKSWCQQLVRLSGQQYPHILCVHSIENGFPHSLLIVCNSLYGRAITRGRLASTQITLCQQLCFCRKRVLKGLFCQKKHGKGISTRKLFWSLPPPSPWLRPWTVSLRKSHFLDGCFPMLLFYELNSIVCQSESITLLPLPTTPAS